MAAVFLAAEESQLSPFLREVVAALRKEGVTANVRPLTGDVPVLVIDFHGVGGTFWVRDYSRKDRPSEIAWAYGTTVVTAVAADELVESFCDWLAKRWVREAEEAVAMLGRRVQFFLLEGEGVE